MITVVHVITKLELGGAQENTLHSVEHLDRSRFRVALIHGPGGYLDARAARIPDLAVLVVPELHREIRPGADAATFGRLVRLYRALLRDHVAGGNDPARFIVHTHSSKAGVLGRLAARGAEVPMIVHTIHGFGFHAGQRPLEQSLLVGAELVASHATDAFISVSEANLAEAIARGFVRPEHERCVIRSGFALAPFLAAGARRSEARRTLGVAGDREVVTVVANLKPQKDPLVMVEAIRLLAERRPRVLCLYAGDGPLRPEVERAIERAGLKERFVLLGWREDVPELLAASDVVALSSQFEGLPRSAVQALAVGRPFVGTRVDGTPEVIRDGRNGFLVEPGDSRALATALERALVEVPIDPEDQVRVGAWDAERMVREQEGFYERLLALRACSSGFGRRRWRGAPGA